MVKGTTTGCTTCGTTPIPNQYMLARVTNECPEVRRTDACACPKYLFCLWHKLVLACASQVPEPFVRFTALIDGAGGCNTMLTCTTCNRSACSAASTSAWLETAGAFRYASSASLAPYSVPGSLVPHG